jgi:hypothetical protein
MRNVSYCQVEAEAEEISLAPAASVAPLELPAALSQETARVLIRMFRNPHELQADERRALIAHLRSAVKREPAATQMRVLLGMALSVDLQAQQALEQLRESVRRAPACFLARIKLGELLMRLRLCSQAAAETEEAVQLASNAIQSGLAQRQAAAIRAMLP